MRKLLGVLVLLLFPTFLRAQTTRACNGTLSDCQAKVTASANGDTVTIPAGSFSWSSAVVVPAGIGITITGTGTPNTASNVFGASASCSQTVIQEGGSHLIDLQPTTTSSLSRISCMKLTAGSTGTSAGALFRAAGTCTSSGCPNFRVDNVNIDPSLESSTLRGDSGAMVGVDNVFGVLDHNTIAGQGLGNGIQFVTYHMSSWLGVGDYGDNSTAAADSMGTAQNIFVENNSFGFHVWVSETEAQVPLVSRCSSTPQQCQGGGRIVVRFNTMNGTTVGLANHGTDSNGRPRGPRHGEFYGNNFTCTNTSSGCQGVGARSGTYIVFGNALSVGTGAWFNQYVGLNVLRTQGVYGPPWNACPGSYDLNSSPPICLDQEGRGGGTLLSGGTPPTGWPNQVLDPIYEWDDSGHSPNFANVSPNSTPSGILTANHDWYSDNSNGTPQAQTSATAPFNGTSGVGFGTIARRPTTCTPGTGGAPGVGYWATDQGNWNTSANTYTGGYSQGQLHVCSASSTPTWQQPHGACTANTGGSYWCLYYTPYTYPHPLVSGGTTGGGPPPTPNPPSGLSATVN